MASAAQREASLARANRRRETISALKADVRGGRLGLGALLEDPRAEQVKVLSALAMVPRCTQRRSLEALLVCQINGARRCGELSGEERAALVSTISQIGQGIALTPRRALSGHPEGADRELDRLVRATRRAVPVVELAPSEYAAARMGLEADPLLLRMVDRLIDAVRLYVERDDGGVRARVVAEQWVRYRNYLGKVAGGEYPPPTQRGPAVAE